jgi:hypothetical protein
MRSLSLFFFDPVEAVISIQRTCILQAAAENSHPGEFLAFTGFFK